jgi:hypothetical protein
MEVPTVPVWCHVCESQRMALYKIDSQEYQCTTCNGNFVEELNQGIEEFLEPEENGASESDNSNYNGGGVNAVVREENLDSTNPSSRTNDSSTSAFDSGQLFQQLIGTVLGIPLSGNTGTTDSNGVTMIRQNGNSGRPVGIVIRQYGFDGNRGGSGSGTLPHGILGLLNSLNAIRSSSMQNNPDALTNEQFQQFLHHILMNESSHSGSAPLADSAIEKLKKLTVTGTTNVSELGECCISQEPFETGDVVVCLPCGHNYKEDPIVHWLKMHATCPVCRIEIASSET